MLVRPHSESPREREERESTRAKPKLWVPMRNRYLEGHDHIHDLGAPAGLLEIADLAAPAIGKSGFSNLFVADRVGGRNILGSDDPRDLGFPQFIVHPGFLAPLNDQIAIEPGSRRLRR